MNDIEVTEDGIVLTSYTASETDLTPEEMEQVDETDLTPEENEQYFLELEEFVSHFAEPTEAELKSYADKMAFLESIHAEIRLTNPDFMPIYVTDDVVDTEILPLDNLSKYHDHNYSVHIQPNTNNN